jgi:glutamate-ammonia-ligase adenylyltransferase
MNSAQPPEHDWEATFTREAKQRLKTLTDFCPVYKNLLRKEPALAQWLERPEYSKRRLHLSAFDIIWQSDFEPKDTTTVENYLLALRRYRRCMSMRIAYRELNHLSSIDDSLNELSHLAEFIVNLVTQKTLEEYSAKWGTPWNEENEIAAKFAVIALGKLGGNELNFCSDIDLIFLYHGKGFCKRNGQKTGFPNSEFYTRTAREIANRLQKNSVYGNLYNVDLRLRPDGQTGPLVPSLTSLENYYGAAGQTWEQIALMKARPIAGDIDLGDDFIETIHSFRYPRSNITTLLQEISGIKFRMEKEVLSEEELQNHIKNGYGSIREIEFYTQALQMLHGAKNPFLQGESTRKAIYDLKRYGVISHQRSEFLSKTYRFFRAIENRLQMAEELQTHILPQEGELPEKIAQNLNFATTEVFLQKLTQSRKKVRKIYTGLFPQSMDEDSIQKWTLFLSGNPPEEPIKSYLKKWFWGKQENAAEGLRRFARGPSHHMLPRENVLLFIEISKSFDHVLPPLAHPLRTIDKVNRFADRYGARKSFLRMCAQNQPLFRAICLLFDRSQFIFRIVCEYPEILEELLLMGIRLNKSARMHLHELNHLQQEKTDELLNSLWLYVRAEQVRIAISGIFTGTAVGGTERALSGMADAVLAYLLQKIDPEGDLILIALGKYGGKEIVFGSDLDLICLHRNGTDLQSVNTKLQKLLRIASYKKGEDRIFDIDMRLRPHGSNGALSTSIDSFEKYHRENAQFWERQILLRSRIIPEHRLRRQKTAHLRLQFLALKQNLLYKAPLPQNAFHMLKEMRLRIEKERCQSGTPYLEYKSGPGGLIDIEFATQALQLAYGSRGTNLHRENTREALRALNHSGFLAPGNAVTLLDNYNYLKTIELELRRQNNHSITKIDHNSDLIHSLSTWIGTDTAEHFLKDLEHRMRQNRTLFCNILNYLEKSASKDYL